MAVTLLVHYDVGERRWVALSFQEELCVHSIRQKFLLDFIPYAVIANFADKVGIQA